MANQITATINLAIEQGDFTDTIRQSTILTQTNPGGGTPGALQLTTSEETVSVAELTGLGLCLIHNLDATNNVVWGPDSTGQVDCGAVTPGMFAVFELAAGTVLKMKASASTVRCIVKVWEA